MKHQAEITVDGHRFALHRQGPQSIRVYHVREHPNGQKQIKRVRSAKLARAVVEYARRRGVLGRAA